MKKILALILVAGMVTFVACGPSKDKIKQQKRLDSLRLDSIKKVREADSLAAVEKEQRKQDSIKADSISKAKDKKGHGTKPKSKKASLPKDKKATINHKTQAKKNN